MMANTPNDVKAIGCEVTVFHLEVQSESLVHDDPPHNWRYRTKLFADGDVERERCFYTIDEPNIYLDALAGLFYVLGYHDFLLSWGSPEGHNPKRRRWTIPRLPQMGSVDDIDENGNVIEI